MRRFLGLALLFLAGLDATATSASAAEGRLRVIAANITSGRLQSYLLPGPGERIFKALEADVVLIQEMNFHTESKGANDSAAVDDYIHAVFGDFHWCREPGGDQIPNGIVSRWPILACGQWRDPEVSNRDFAWARIDLPDSDKDLWAVSVHFLTKNSRVRRNEALELVKAVRAEVPADDYLVVGGDFNSKSRVEPLLRTLSTIVEVDGPYPDDGAFGGTNASRRKPYDWVLADAELDLFEVEVAFGDKTFPDGFVFDSRKYSQEELDELFPPVRKGDSGEENMQHMAVVRDFQLPVVPRDDPNGQDPRVGLFLAAPRAVDFGLVDAAAGPVEATVQFLVEGGTVHLYRECFGGADHAEWELVSLELSNEGLAVEDSAVLVFRWTPAANDGRQRRVVATFGTDAGPFDVVFTGSTLAPVVVEDPP
jgi:endonuclease/exonuclease/phosphatase family metal-dependent hydrolase